MLAVDVGNTFTRLAAFQDEEIVLRRSFLTRELSVPELTGTLRDLAAGLGSSTVWVASVKPATNPIVDSAAEQAGLFRRFIRPGVDAIIPHRLRSAETTGVDRLLSALAAGAKHFCVECPAKGYIVIQCGSAATVDYVDGSGVFRGGYILPGPTFWLSGLADAAQLPDLSREWPEWSDTFIGDNTRDAILHGMAAALPLAVASSAMLINTEMGDGGEAGDLPMVLTGGWGTAVSAFMRGQHLFDKDLLLHGIRLFAERNTQ